METEELLLQRLREGQEEALSRVIRIYTPYVAAILRRQCGGNIEETDLEELVSDVFFALWKRRKLLKTDHLRGWLAQAAKNRARSFLRRNRIIPISTEDLIAIPDQLAPDLAEQTVRKLWLEQALSTLGPESREIFLRHYRDGKTVAEISDEMNLNPSTVKSRLRRGRLALKEVLTQGGTMHEAERI